MTLMRPGARLLNYLKNAKWLSEKSKIEVEAAALAHVCSCYPMLLLMRCC